MAQAGRNAPCPCGSGKKYKHCCLAKDDAHQASAATAGTYQAPATGEIADELRAIDWFLKNYEEAANDVISVFFQDTRLGLREKIEKLPEVEKSSLLFNLHEWLIAEGKIDTDDALVKVSDVLLGPDGPLLSANGRRYIEDLAVSTLSIYEVLEVHTGKGLLLRDMVYTDEPPVFVHDREASFIFSPLGIMGVRILRRGDFCRMAVGAYPFEPAIGQKIVDVFIEKAKREIEIRAYTQYTPEELISFTIVGAWLYFNAMQDSIPITKLH
jgi:hypothetical protein